MPQFFTCINFLALQSRPDIFEDQVKLASQNMEIPTCANGRSDWIMYAQVCDKWCR